MREGGQVGRSNTWQVDEVTNAIEREGEELRGLHSQLADLLQESKERAREEEVGEIFFQQTKLIEIQVVATLLRLQVQLEATLQTLHTFCLLLDQVVSLSSQHWLTHRHRYKMIFSFKVPHHNDMTL